MRTRLRHLERGFADAGCPVCRGRRGLTALIEAGPPAGGATAAEGDRPA